MTQIILHQTPILIIKRYDALFSYMLLDLHKLHLYPYAWPIIVHIYLKVYNFSTLIGQEIKHIFLSICNDFSDFGELFSEYQRG